MRGFVIVGSTFNSYLLQIITVIIVVFMFFAGIYDMFTLGSNNYLDNLDQFAGVSRALTSGILQILFGISLLKLNSKLGIIVSVTAVFEIIVGVFFISIIGVFVGLFLLIPTEILEIIVLYKVVEKLKNKH